MNFSLYLSSISLFSPRERRPDCELGALDSAAASSPAKQVRSPQFRSKVMLRGVPRGQNSVLRQINGKLANLIQKSVSPIKYVFREDSPPGGEIPRGRILWD